MVEQMMSDKTKLLNSELYAQFRRCGVLFNGLDHARKWGVMLAVFGLIFVCWQVVLQSMIAARLESSSASLLELESDERATRQQIERFQRLKAERKLVSISEYRGQMSSRTAISNGLGQWGEQYGLFLNSSEQVGDELALHFTGTYPATLRFFERLANEADGLVAFKRLQYRVAEEYASGGFADIELQVMLKK